MNILAPKGRRRSLSKADLQCLEYIDGSPLKKMPLKPSMKSYYKQFERKGLVMFIWGKGVNSYNHWVAPTFEGMRLLREYRERKARARVKRRADAAARRELEKLKKASL